MKSIVSSLVILVAVSSVAASLDYRDRDRDRVHSEICACTCVRIEGVITSVDEDAQQITVDDGGLITVQGSDATRIHMGSQALSFGDLAVGQTVAVGDITDGDVFEAFNINVKYQGQ